MPACTVCNHAKNQEINRALIRGGESNRALARRFGLTQASIDRHKRNHLRPYMSEAIAEDPELADVNPLVEIKSMYYRVKSMLARAEDIQDLTAFRTFHAEARKDLELLGKLLGEIGDSSVQVHISPAHAQNPTREQQFEDLFKEIEQFRRENSA